MATEDISSPGGILQNLTSIPTNSSTPPTSSTTTLTPSLPLRLWNGDMSEFFVSLDRYHPTVPDSVVQYHLSKAGVTIKDSRINRLIALAADKFLAELIYESKQSAILKKRNKGRDKRKLEEISECLQLSDLNYALQAKRISISRRIKEFDD